MAACNDRKAYYQAYYQANKEAKNTYYQAYYQANKEARKAAVARHRKKHPVAVRIRNSRRRAAKLNATPVWANQFFIEEAYDLAQRRNKVTGLEWQVDHIVPLQSKLVCGLHTDRNIQVIPKAINISKGNRYWPDMPA